jgi:hypothetical protein
MVTFDESCFYWEIDWEQQCLPEDDQSGTRTRRGFNHNKTLLTTVWNPNDFRLIDAMPKGEKHIARYYVDNVLTPIGQRLIPTGKRKLVLQANNSRCHITKVILDFFPQTKVRFTPHRPYSSDIAPSDFSFSLA